MKVAIFGAIGDTGKQLTQQELSLEHEVTAFVRNPIIALEHSVFEQAGSYNKTGGSLR
jgi:putative NADH-flavin reductase